MTDGRAKLAWSAVYIAAPRAIRAAVARRRFGGATAAATSTGRASPRLEASARGESSFAPTDDDAADAEHFSTLPLRPRRRFRERERYAASKGSGSQSIPRLYIRATNRIHVQVVLQYNLNDRTSRTSTTYLRSWRALSTGGAKRNGILMFNSNFTPEAKNLIPCNRPPCATRASKRDNSSQMSRVVPAPRRRLRRSRRRPANGFRRLTAAFGDAAGKAGLLKRHPIAGRPRSAPPARRPQNAVDASSSRSTRGPLRPGGRPSPSRFITGGTALRSPTAPRREAIPIAAEALSRYPSAREGSETEPCGRAFPQRSASGDRAPAGRRLGRGEAPHGLDESGRAPRSGRRRRRLGARLKCSGG